MSQPSLWVMGGDQSAKESGTDWIDTIKRFSLDATSSVKPSWTQLNKDSWALPWTTWTLGLGLCYSSSDDALHFPQPHIGLSTRWCLLGTGTGSSLSLQTLPIGYFLPHSRYLVMFTNWVSLGERTNNSTAEWEALLVTTGNRCFSRSQLSPHPTSTEVQ